VGRRLERLAGRRPLGVALGAVVVVLVVMGVAAAAGAVVLGADLSGAQSQIAGQVGGIAFLLLVLWMLGWLDAAGVSRLGPGRVWLVTWIILIYTGVCALWSFFGTVAVDLSVDAAAGPVLLSTTLAGVVEELLFRGLVLYVLVAGWGGTRRGVAAAVVVSALLFGASHLVNLASGAADITLLQTTEAALSAVVYGALVVVGRSVWPAVALHSLVNLLVNTAAENVSGFEVGASDYVMFTLLQIPVVLFAVHLLATQALDSTQRPGGRSNVHGVNADAR
jgi:membrane protease YdiL (CAAX protease family)